MNTESLVSIKDRISIYFLDQVPTDKKNANLQIIASSVKHGEGKTIFVRKTDLLMIDFFFSFSYMIPDFYSFIYLFLF